MMGKKDSSRGRERPKHSAESANFGCQCFMRMTMVGMNSMAENRFQQPLSSSKKTQKHNGQQQILGPAESHHFLGENWRTCCHHLHIVDATRLVFLADLTKLILESAYFVAHIGFVDAICFLQICWTLIGIALALPSLHRRNGQRYYRYLWPLLALKITECIVCLIVLLLIFVLGVFGPLGYSILRLLIKWKYRRVEDANAIAFSLGTFLIVSFLLVLNCYFLHIYWHLRTYLRAKAVFLYLSQRNQAIRAIRPSFFLI